MRAISIQLAGLAGRGFSGDVKIFLVLIRPLMIKVCVSKIGQVVGLV